MPPLVNRQQHIEQGLDALVRSNIQHSTADCSSRHTIVAVDLWHPKHLRLPQHQRHKAVVAVLHLRSKAIAEHSTSPWLPLRTVATAGHSSLHSSSSSLVRLVDLQPHKLSLLAFTACIARQHSRSLPSHALNPMQSPGHVSVRPSILSYDLVHFLLNGHCHSGRQLHDQMKRSDCWQLHHCLGYAGCIDLYCHCCNSYCCRVHHLVELGPIVELAMMSFAVDHLRSPFHKDCGKSYHHTSLSLHRLCHLMKTRLGWSYHLFLYRGLVYDYCCERIPLEVFHLLRCLSPLTADY